MSKSSLFPSLPEIDFAQKDPDAVVNGIAETYRNLAGRELQRGDPVMLFLKAVALELIQQRHAVDYAAKMNLLAYAEGAYLDHIGALLGVYRLEASKASCTGEIVLSSPPASGTVIPAGTRITPDGKILFALEEPILIPAGESSGTGRFACTETGEQGNGYAPGEICRLADVLPYEASARNTGYSSGGSDTESDEAFRERIHIAPESFTTAGSVKGYEYYALGADSGIQSVGIEGPPDAPPGHVNIYVLMKGGLMPDDSVLAKVLEACSAEDVRPDTDYVSALRPEASDYGIKLEYWIAKEDSARADAIASGVEEAVKSFASWQSGALGRDINPSRLVHAVIAAGASRCAVEEPEYRELKKSQAARLVSSEILFMGLES